LGVQMALARLNVLWMDEDALGIRSDSLVFTNVNCPEEWAAVQVILSNESALTHR